LTALSNVVCGWVMVMPSRMSKAARRRMNEVGGDKEAVRLRLEQMSRGGGSGALR